jgi:hypothetical protein
MNLTSNDFYERVSPISPIILNLLGSYLLLSMILGIVFNTLLLYIFKKYKDLQTPINTFIIAMTVLNLLGTIFELPWIIHSCFSHKWTSGKFGCDLSSTIMFFIGCTSAYLMAAISFERFYIMYKPLNIRNISYKLAYIIILLCCLFGLFWSIMPLLGWSYYTMEDGLVSCAVEFKGSNWNIRSFIISIFIFVYCIPFSIIIFSSLYIIIMLFRKPNLSPTQNNENKKISMQRSVTKYLLLYISILKY